MRDLFVEIMRSPETALAGAPAGLALLAVLVASLGGSVHCAAMCGAFPVLLRAAAEGQRKVFWRGPVVLYHFGRAATYIVLGALAGGFGRVALDSGAVGALAVAAALAMGAALAMSGLVLLRPEAGGAASGGRADVAAPASKASRPGRVRYAVARAAQSLSSRALRVARAHTSGAALVGAASVLLPCGWLYGFVLAAAATGSASYGALVMLFFWLGTVPALSVLPGAYGAFMARSRLGLRRFAGVLLIAAGVATIGVRIAPVLHQHASGEPVAEHSCH